jgi:hypothetical protein
MKLIYIPTSSGGGIVFTKVENYSALPPAAEHTDELFYVKNDQGTSWLPGTWGGTYYPQGWYYSDGVTWEFTEMPWQATQSDVNAGIIENQFVSPFTLGGWLNNVLTRALFFTGIVTFSTVRFTPITASFSGTYTSDLSLANIFILTMTGNGVLDFSNAQVGAYQWIITTNGHTLTLAVGKFQGEFDVAGKALITGTYDGSKMVIASIKNLTDI